MKMRCRGGKNTIWLLFVALLAVCVDGVNLLDAKFQISSNVWVHEIGDMIFVLFRVGFASLWFVSAPIYAGFVCFQLRVVKSIEYRGGSPALLKKLALCQIWAVFLPFILYPLMPGLASNGALLGRDEKANLACLLTFVLILSCQIINMVLMLVWLMRLRSTGSAGRVSAHETKQGT